MIMICERCLGSIDSDEPVLRLAHFDTADLDGNISWVHTYVHTAACLTPRPAPHERPDTGAWDRSRGIGGLLS